MSEGLSADGGERQRVRDAADALDYSLFADNPQPMWLFDPERHAFVDVNGAALELYGYTRDEFLALSLADIETPSDASSGDRKVLRHVTHAGGSIAVELVSRMITRRGRPVRLVVVHDVSRRVEIEERLRESERRFRDVLENMMLATVTLDLGGRVTFVNQAGAELLGWEREALLGRDWFSTCVPAEEAEEVRRGFLSRVGRGAIRRYDESHVITQARVRRLVQWSNIVLRDGRGEITGTALVGQDVTDQRELERRLWQEARHDGATGLPNRVLLMEKIAHVVERARTLPDSSYALLFVDLDRFKVVNDSLGMAVGDQLLAAAGQVLQRQLGTADLLARIGGDEFAVLLDGAGTERATSVAQAVCHAFAAPMTVAGNEVFTTASVGIVVRSASHASPEDVLRDAESALHRAKALGRNRWELFRPNMRAGARQRLKLENDLRRALSQGELRLVYQPIVGMNDGHLVAFEALVRWARPGLGPVAPSEFIPVAEETGLIGPLGEWVLRTACTTVAGWVRDVPAAAGIVVNVNVSGRQLAPGFREQIDRALADSGLRAEQLKIEVTESVIMDSFVAAADLLRRIKQRGVRVCIDDFGTGYSSLGHLVRLPIDTMKIDRMFVDGMGGDAHTAEVVKSIVALARSLSLEVVAEGVETEEQRAALAKLGCELAQGYLFARPLEVAQVLELFASGSESSHGPKEAM
jgi:diguanylate cyclase (GGDEF)-like protein/PAS domain S-box-containing protein